MDIDKQPPVFRAKDGRLYYQVEFADYDSLINQLKACREEKKKLQELHDFLTE